MEDIAKILANYGFPIAITMFLLIRMEKTIGELKNAIDELCEKVSILCEKKRK